MIERREGRRVGRGNARRFPEEAFNSGNLDVVDELVAPEFVDHDAALPEPATGIEATKASIKGYRDAFPDLRLTIEQQLAEGEYMTTRWSARGTHQDDLLGMLATGKQATVTGITIDRIVAGASSRAGRTGTRSD